ncbi:MAG: hypothetical protein N4A47_07320 [Clostridia bacterium]|nr:hypothetical protein [Clostridia bacterium]
MKEIVFVTSNKGKIESARKELKGVSVLAYEAELIEPRSEDIKEIAKQKVMQAYNIVKKPCIAVDVGFFVKELNGFPKAYVNHMLGTIGVEGLIKLMKGAGDRSAEFRHCLAYYDGEIFKFFEDKAEGSISESIRGNDNAKKWSELWYIFIPKWTDKTLAEFTEEDYKKHLENKDDKCMQDFAKWYLNN